MLLIAAVIVTSGPGLPVVGYLLYPFTILTTWFHEMGHGLTALLMGLTFEELVIYPDGSGFAQSSGAQDPSALSSALIAMGGPLGPSIAGSGLILATGNHRFWRPALYGLAAVIALSVAIWVRSPVGLVVLPIVGAVMVVIALFGRDWMLRFSLQFLGVLAALSMFRDWDYLFTENIVLGGEPMLSDTGAMEAALWLPHWFWAVIIILISGAMIGWSLKRALAEEGGPPRMPPRNIGQWL